MQEGEDSQTDPFRHLDNVKSSAPLESKKYNGKIPRNVSNTTADTKNRKGREANHVVAGKRFISWVKRNPLGDQNPWYGRHRRYQSATIDPPIEACCRQSILYNIFWQPPA